MNKFLLITKINLLQTFSLTKNNNSKFKSERRKKSLKTMVAVLIIGYIMCYVYYLARTLMPSFIFVGKPIYLMGFLFTICSVYIFFMNIFRVKSFLFDFKDYDLLMSLPISRNMVIASKIVSQYIINLLYTFIIMIPGYLAYISFANMPSDLLFFILLFAIPVIPLLVSTIIGIILSWITSFFRNKNIGSYVVNFALIFIVLFISFNISNINEVEMVNKSINIVDTFSKYYPFTTLFVSLLEDVNIINLLIYFLLPVVLMAIFIGFINTGYIPLRSRLLKQNIRSNFELEDEVSKTPLISLYQKELKKYFSNALGFINTAFGCVILIVLIISILLFNDSMISRFHKILDINATILSNIYLIISLLCVISCTTSSSISLEGKSFWIMKTIPVSCDTIFLSKIMVNLTVLIPTIIISGTFFGIYLHAPLIDFLLLYLMPLSYAFFTSLMGLLLNLLFPKFEFENEMKVIKQSLPAFLSILIGIIMVIVPINLLDINTNSLILITSIVYLIDIVIALILHYYGRKKFKEL